MSEDEKPKLTIVKPKKPHKKLVKKVKRVLNESDGPHHPGAGRPAMRQEIMDWEPTKEDRQKVKLLTSAKRTPEEIGKIICPFGVVSGSTVRRRFKEEIKCGKIELELSVAEKAYEMAISGKSPLMTIFWLRCAGWKERETTQLGVKEDVDSEAIAKKMQQSAKYMAETLPAPTKTQEGNG